MSERWLVEYKLDGLDIEMPVTMEYDAREKAISEQLRLATYHDLVYFRLERLSA